MEIVFVEEDVFATFVDEQVVMYCQIEKTEMEVCSAVGRSQRFCFLVEVKR